MTRQDWKNFKDTVQYARRGIKMINGHQIYVTIGFAWRHEGRHRFVDLNPYRINLKTGVYETLEMDWVDGCHVEVPNLKEYLTEQ